jgi:hypothetical protein
MKDWKTDLLGIKIKASLQNEVKSSHKSPVERTAATKASSIRPIEIEKKILAIIGHIESLTTSLTKIAPYPLVKGNSKKIKHYQREIKILKEEFTTLCYKFRPSLISSAKIQNTNALLIEMKNELQERDARYQKMLIAEQQLQHEKLNTERKLRLDKERAEAKAREEDEERKQKWLKEKKKILSKNALSLIKEYGLHRCEDCKDGKISVLCQKCSGTRRLSKAIKGTITERFQCGNLKPNCNFCFGTGFFSKQKEGLTYECNACSYGKNIELCKTCKGLGILINRESTIPKNDILKSLESSKELVAEIQKIIGK